MRSAWELRQWWDRHSPLRQCRSDTGEPQDFAAAKLQRAKLYHSGRAKAAADIMDHDAARVGGSGMAPDASASGELRAPRTFRVPRNMVDLADLE